jgi:hypothetical protein
MESHLLEEEMKRILYLPLCAEFFEQIKAGTKMYEYRRDNSYWRARLLGKGGFDGIVLTKGYPKAGDESRRLFRPWLGMNEERIRHPLFGSTEVDVFAIRVN